jgi:hypothetical protein
MKKKAFVTIRKTWKRNPATKIKDSLKKYNRKKTKRESGLLLKREHYEEDIKNRPSEGESSGVNV